MLSGAKPMAMVSWSFRVGGSVSIRDRVRVGGRGRKRVMGLSKICLKIYII